MGSCQFSKKVKLDHRGRFLGDFFGAFSAGMGLFVTFVLRGPTEVGAPSFFLDFRIGPMG